VPNQSVHLLTPPPEAESAATTPAPAIAPATAATDLDRAIDRYRAIGAAQNHKYGDKSTPAPNYNAPIEGTPPPAPNTPSHP
jgi:hypothetical protein